MSMNTIKTTVSLGIFVFSSVAFAIPPHLPNLTDDGNLWSITAYYDESPVHKPAATQKICFFNDGVAGTHQRYIWVSISFRDWNGRASQEGDQVTMFGDFGNPSSKKDVGHDSIEWEIVTDNKKNIGAGHWREWVEDGAFGRTVGFGNAVFHRIGRCPYTSPESALQASQNLPTAVDANGVPIPFPLGQPNVDVK